MRGGYQHRRPGRCSCLPVPVAGRPPPAAAHRWPAGSAAPAGRGRISGRGRRPPPAAAGRTSACRSLAFADSGTACRLRRLLWRLPLPRASTTMPRADGTAHSSPSRCSSPITMGVWLTMGCSHARGDPHRVSALSPQHSVDRMQSLPLSINTCAGMGNHRVNLRRSEPTRQSMSRLPPARPRPASAAGVSCRQSVYRIRPRGNDFSIRLRCTSLIQPSAASRAGVVISNGTRRPGLMLLNGGSRRDAITVVPRISAPESSSARSPNARS